MGGGLRSGVFFLFLLGAVGLAGCGRIAATTPARHAPVGASLLASLAARESAQSASDAAPLTAEAECAQFRSSLPAIVQQGFVEVPENWDAPDGVTVRVYYYFVPASNADAASAAAPVVFFNGGPAASSHSSYSVLSDLLEDKNLPFVFIDQRGNGCSSPFPSEPSAETMRRLSHYTSRAVVRDAEAIRRTLFGDRKWRAFGQSYGGQIVHRYAIVAPEGLEAVYSHGYAAVSDPAQEIRARILSQERVSEDYFAKYPADREAIQTLRALIPPDRCFLDGSSRVCGNGVWDAAIAILGFQDSWETLHETLGGLISTPRGETPQINEDNLSAFVTDSVFGIFANNPLASAALEKIEQLDGKTFKEICKDLIHEQETAGDRPWEWSFHECRLIVALETAADAWIDQVTLADSVSPAAVLRALEAHPELPFFLYSGGLDVFSPIAFFSEETEVLGSRIRYTHFPQSGHEGFFTEAQVWADLRQEISRTLASSNF